MVAMETIILDLAEDNEEVSSIPRVGQKFMLLK
jgi:hypothetical protein